MAYPTTRLSSAAGGTSETTTYSWDSSIGGITCSNGIGRLCKVVDNRGASTFAYEPFGNLSQQRNVETSLTQNLGFGYDGEDRLSSSTTSASRALALVRDSEGRVSQVLGIVAGSAAQVVKSSSYVADGRTDKATLGNSLVIDRDFDASGLMTGVTEQIPVVQDADVPTAPEWAMIILGALLIGQMVRSRQRHLLPMLFIGLLALSLAPAWAGEALQYDARGNIKGRTVDGNASVYNYDVLDRVVNESGKVAQPFCYDANGNRTCDLQASYTVSPNSNRLATRAGVAITYDPAGNTLTDRAIVAGTLSSRTFTYWLSDQLKTVSINSAPKATYTYNANRQRTRKVLNSPPTNTPGTTLYRYDPNGHLLEEIAGTAFTGSLGASIPAGTSLTTYVWRDEVPAAVIYAPGTVSNPTATERIVYLEADHLNTPRKATDSAGKVVWTWESDAFGSSLPNEDPDNDGKKTVVNLRFPGQYFDAESGLHYNWHRYYDPQVGRYTQPDPLGLAAGSNPYEYVSSAPLGAVDPQGLRSWTIGFFPGVGAQVTFGQNPNGSGFASFQFGWGIGGGFSYNPLGKQPGYEECQGASWGVGTGIYTQASFRAGPVGASAGANLGRNFRSTDDKLYGGLPFSGSAKDRISGISASASLGGQITVFGGGTAQGVCTCGR